MEQNYYILHQLPDLSLSRYTTLDEGNVDGVLKSHATFWRQMHRRGILTQDAFHLFYEYDPQRPAGHRLQVGLRVDTQRPGSELFVDQTIQSSPSGLFTICSRSIPGRMAHRWPGSMPIRRIW